MRKILGILVDIMIGIFLVVSLIFVICKVSGRSDFLGYTLVKVKTGSMCASGIDVGDVRLIHKELSYDIGDVIAFNHGHSIYFHQIVEITSDGMYITQGTSNAIVDIGSVGVNDIIGKQVIDANVGWVTSIYPRLIFMGLTYFFVMWYLVSTFIKSFKEVKKSV